MTHEFAQLGEHSVSGNALPCTHLHCNSVLTKTYTQLMFDTLRQCGGDADVHAVTPGNKLLCCCYDRCARDTR